MKILIAIILVLTPLMACTSASKSIAPEIYPAMFPGFSFTRVTISTPSLTGYEYQTNKGKALNIKHCQQANNTDVARIADYDYFRFKLLTLSCKAVEKYSLARPSSQSYFPSKLNTQFIAQLPAEVVPLLSKTDLTKRLGKTLGTYDKNTQLQSEGAHTTKLLTKDDEFYITELARGDFTGDGIEDVLIKTEWYARHAHGKHADLLILSMPNKAQSVTVFWRLNKFE